MCSHPCPVCKCKNSVRKAFTQREIDTYNNQLEQEKERRVAQNELLPADQRKKLRSKRKKVQQYYCVCFSLGKDKCACCVGPFTDADRGKLSGWFQDYQNGIEENQPPTVTNNVGRLFQQIVNHSIQV